MAVTIRTAITYDKSRNENSGHTDVEKVSIRRWRDDCIITLQGSGRLGKTELRLPPALARADPAVARSRESQSCPRGRPLPAGRHGRMVLGNGARHGHAGPDAAATALRDSRARA